MLVHSQFSPVVGHVNYFVFYMNANSSVSMFTILLGLFGEVYYC